MVTIVNYKKLMSSAGKEFYSLILQGGIEMVRSAETGNFYATVKQCSITSTLNEEGCKTVLGEKLPGSIEKVSCEPYEYVVADTGEVIELAHRWAYVPTEVKQDRLSQVTIPDFNSVEALMA
jgi:hypothetical protein